MSSYSQVLPGQVLSGFIPEPMLFPHVVNAQRSGVTGHDDSGGPIVGWVTAYAGLVCLIAPGSGLDVLSWQQKGMSCSHKIHFPSQPGTIPGGLGLPALTVRDRIVFAPPNGPQRTFQVQFVEDNAEMGLLLTADVLEARRPA